MTSRGWEGVARTRLERLVADMVIRIRHMADELEREARRNIASAAQENRSIEFQTYPQVAGQVVGKVQAMLFHLKLGNLIDAAADAEAARADAAREIGTPISRACEEDERREAMKYTSRWEMPEVTFYQVEGHGFEAYEGQPLYAYGKPDETDSRGIPKTGELYPALDRALVAWVSEKYTGSRGAGGTGIGTAADWFMRMIGADQLVEVNHQDGQKALQEVVADTRQYDGPIYQQARAMSAGLEKRGLVLAALNHGR